MTEATFKRGQELLNEIKALETVVCSLNYTVRRKPVGQEKKNWKLRLTNRKKDNPSSPEQAGVILFDGLSFVGLDIPVDEALVEHLRVFFEKRLEDKQHEFDELGG